jgi:superkiller protein 3
MEKAVATYKRLIEMDPENYRVHFNIGTLFFQNRWFKEAKNSFKEAIRFKPNHPSSQYYLARIAVEQKEHEKAIQILRKLSKKDMDNALIHTDLGILLSERKRFDEAIRELKQAIKIDPGYLKALYNLGLTFQEMKLLDRAVEMFQKCIEKGEDSEFSKKSMEKLQEVKGIIY